MPERHDTASAAQTRWPFSHDGLIVAPLSTDDGSATIYAEVVPSGSRWLPWFGRTSRWWYEVHSVEDEGGEPWGHTWAYTDGGSGGGFTLAACVRRAESAVWNIVDRVNAQNEDVEVKALSDEDDHAVS